MKIVIYLPNEEAKRTIEEDDENLLEAYRYLIRKIEQIAGGQQIRYDRITVEE